MVNIDRRLEDIKALVDQNKYFTINRARQYGKTTTLKALAKYLREEYYVVSMDFQKFDALKFENGNIFSVSFLTTFLRLFQTNRSALTDGVRKAIDDLKECMILQGSYFGMKELFEGLSDICSESEKPVVLIIDEVDSAANNQVFLDFLAQLRAYYIDRRERAAFWSVILAGVYDIKNLRYKIRPEDEHKVNSPWNIAADFEIDMSLSKEGIAGMLLEYEADYHTGMDVEKMAEEIYQYTSGYPFLVSRLCQLMDEKVSRQEEAGSKAAAWTKEGFLMAVNMLLAEKNTLFESLIGKLDIYPSLNAIIKDILFAGRPVACNPDLAELDLAAMFGFIKNQKGLVEVANRIFETRLYNLYLSAEELRNQDICRRSTADKSQFITDGHLNMRRILEKFAEHFHELYGNREDTFKEEEGRTYFLLYLRPIINGTGNYYIEARTRNMTRTDLIVDYHGEQYVVEMKIWHGNEYNNRGERQLIGYLDDYGLKKGYMISFNFNKKKEVGVKELVIGDKVLIEAVI